MSLSIELRFRAYGTAVMAPPHKERTPQLRFYLTRNARSMITIPLSADRPKDYVSIKFDVAGVDEARAIDLLSVHFLNVDGITELHTPLIEWARKTAGSSDVPLVHMFGENPRGATLELNVGQAGNQYAAKMTVVLEPAGPILINGKEVKLKGDSAVVQRLRNEQSAKNNYKLKHYVYSTHFLFTLMQPTFEQVRRINCFTFPLRTGRLMPSVAYIEQSRTRFSDPKYFEQNLGYILRRENISMADFLALKDTDNASLNIMMQTLSIWANHALYAGDNAYLVHKQHGDGWPDSTRNKMRSPENPQLVDLEEMEQARLYGADDCEGLGADIIENGFALLDLKGILSDGILKLQRIRKLYVFFLTLAGVTTADIGGDFASLRSSDTELGAHMFCLAIPVAKTLELIERCNKARPLFKPIPLSLEDPSASKGLPILFGEGTGLLHPLPVPLPPKLSLCLPKSMMASTSLPKVIAGVSKHIKVGVLHLNNERIVCLDRNNGAAHFKEIGTTNSAVTNNSLWVTRLLQKACPKGFKGIRVLYWVQKHGENHFYTTLQLGLTHDFVRLGYGATSFVFARRDGNAWTAGVTIDDLFAEDSPVGLWPESELQKDELEAITAEMRNAPPALPFKPAPDVLGKNNMEWDLAAPVLTVDQAKQVKESFDRLQFAAIHTAFIVLVELFDNADSAGVVGSLFSCPLREKCPCGAWNVVAKRVLQERQELFIALRTALKLPPDASYETTMSTVIERFEKVLIKHVDHNLPIVGAYGINRQQMLRTERVDAMQDYYSRPNVLEDESETTVFKVPTTFHYDPEQITAGVGGYTVKIGFLFTK